MAKSPASALIRTREKTWDTEGPEIFYACGFPAIGNRNPGSFLPAVLQRVQAKECHPRHILAGGAKSTAHRIPPEDTHSPASPTGLQD